VRDVWQQRYAHHVRQPLDVAQMQRAADLLLGEHDFRAFAADLGPRAAHLRTTRTVSRADCSRDGAHVVFDLTASAFLRHMVRGIVGTLLQVGRHTIGVADFGAILRARDRRRAGPNVPPAGLTLVGIDYA
jgi:tRNA pseudouridine38-40 synthase